MIYLNLIDFQSWHLLLKSSESEFNEFEPRLKSAKNRFQLSAGLDLKKNYYSFKWNQPYLIHGLHSSRCSNSLNSASGKEEKC